MLIYKIKHKQIPYKYGERERERGYYKPLHLLYTPLQQTQTYIMGRYNP